MLWIPFFTYRSASKNFVHFCARVPKPAHGLNSMSQTPSGRFGALSTGFGTVRQLLLTLIGHANSSATREDANTGLANRRTFQVTVLAIVFVMLSTSPSAAEDSKPIPLERHGRALAERMCSACHAVGRRGKSPHIGAPAFRALHRRVELDTFTDRLREGLMSDHPDMPTFRFTREDARALVLYLRSSSRRKRTGRGRRMRAGAPARIIDLNHSAAGTRALSIAHPLLHGAAL